MELKKRLYALRMAKGLSQADLAEHLEVSRQSVSKWETGASVPDLEKLVRISDYFGVSLDELVRGSAPPPPAECENSIGTEKEKQNGRLIPSAILASAGAILALLPLLFFGPGGWLYSVILGVPFLASGVLVWKCRRPGLWCAWAFDFGVGLYLYSHTMISWQLTLHTIGFSASENYTRLAIAWAILLVRLILTALTMLREGKGRPLSDQGLGLLGSALLVLLLIRPPYSLCNTDLFLGRTLIFLISWLRLLLTALVLTGLLRKRKQ